MYNRTRYVVIVLALLCVTCALSKSALRLPFEVLSINHSMKYSNCTKLSCTRLETQKSTRTIREHLPTYPPLTFHHRLSSGLHLLPDDGQQQPSRRKQDLEIIPAPGRNRFTTIDYPLQATCDERYKDFRLARKESEPLKKKIRRRRKKVYICTFAGGDEM